jgi:transcriptional regulator
MGFQIPNYQKLAQAYAERKVRVLELLAQGITQTEIARQLGITRARVSQIAKAAREASE